MTEQGRVLAEREICAIADVRAAKVVGHPSGEGLAVRVLATGGRSAAEVVAEVRAVTLRATGLLLRREDVQVEVQRNQPAPPAPRTPPARPATAPPPTSAARKNPTWPPTPKITSAPPAPQRRAAVPPPAPAAPPPPRPSAPAASRPPAPPSPPPPGPAPRASAAPPPPPAPPTPPPAPAPSPAPAPPPAPAREPDPPPAPEPEPVPVPEATREPEGKSKARPAPAPLEPLPSLILADDIITARSPSPVITTPERPTHGDDDESGSDGVTPFRTGRVTLDGVLAVRQGLDSTVEVTLLHDGRTRTGSAKGAAASSVVLRLVIEATLAALSQIRPTAFRLAIDTVQVSNAGASSVAVVTLVLLDTSHEEVLVGSAVVRDVDVHEAVARAALDATNRRLQLQG